MFFIFGWRTDKKLVCSVSSDRCGSCMLQNAAVDYYIVTKRFTIFFIPLGGKSRYYRLCRHCGAGQEIAREQFLQETDSILRVQQGGAGPAADQSAAAAHFTEETLVANAAPANEGIPQNDRQESRGAIDPEWERIYDKYFNRLVKRERRDLRGFTGEEKPITATGVAVAFATMTLVFLVNVFLCIYFHKVWMFCVQPLTFLLFIGGFGGFSDVAEKRKYYRACKAVEPSSFAALLADLGKSPAYADKPSIAAMDEKTAKKAFSDYIQAMEILYQLILNRHLSCIGICDGEISKTFIISDD